MVKRIVSLLLACILVLALTACGDSADTASAKTSSQAEQAGQAVANPTRPQGAETGKSSGTVKATWTVSSAITLEQNGVKLDSLDATVRAFLTKGLAQTTIDYTDESNKDITTEEPMPLTFSWTLQGVTATSAKAFFSENTDLSDAMSVEATGNTAVVYNLKPDTRYFWWVEAQTASGVLKSNVATVDIEDGPYLMKVGGVQNVRDLGGWTTLDGRKMKTGLVLRSARLGNIDANGLALMTKLGVKTELDLRKDDECTDMADAVTSLLGNGVRYVRNSSSAYAAFIGGEDVPTSLRLFADEANYPIVFHCAAGADRTGSLAAALEAICNCSEATVVTDFELTANRARKGAFETMITKLNKEFGDTLQEKMMNTCYTMGMTRMEVSNIYNILMTDSGIFASDSLSKAKDVDGKKAFTLNLRQSGGIDYVSVDGYKVDWTLDGNTLTVDATKGFGFIVFKDGDFLEFRL